MFVCSVAACGGGGSANYVAKVGSQPITKKQLRVVLATARAQYSWAFPARGTAEYRLVQEQAIDLLVQQSLAHQVDAELRIKPEDTVVTDASWRKVVGGVHVSDAQVEAVFAKNPKRFKRGPNRTLDLGTADEIRSELLDKERAAAMHRFVTAAEKRWSVTYAPGYKPVSEMALARKVWTAGPKKTCDLPAGAYTYAKARAHGCLDTVPIPGEGSPACSLLSADNAAGFTSAEEDDGYANYLEDNGGTCSPDPRPEPVQVEAQPSNTRVTPVKVSYLHAGGTRTFKDPQSGLMLRYPRRLHLHGLSNGPMVIVEGVEIANYSITPAAASEPLPDRGIDLQLTQGDRPFRVTRAGAVEKLPIRLTEADIAPGRYMTQFSADGMTFQLTIRTGKSPSRQDVEALKAIVASIHFPPLRIGGFSPSGLYVLGRASAYPIGSVTEIPAGLPLPAVPNPELRSGRFYLEHTRDGFWQVSWPDNLLHGYKACGPHWDAAHRRFTCPSGAVWNIEGQVVRNPHPSRDQDDPLDRTPVATADGDLLVSLPPPPG